MNNSPCPIMFLEIKIKIALNETQESILAALKGRMKLDFIDNHSSKIQSIIELELDQMRADLENAGYIVEIED